MRRARRRTRRAREGAVLLIVMMILLVATTMAAISLQATQYELRAAGFARSATQTQYVSETAIATTMAWYDELATGGLRAYVDRWNALSASNNPPQLELYGEPRLTAANRLNTMRAQWLAQAELTNVNLPPITVPGASDDPVGTFGPRVAARPGIEDSERADDTLSDYIVDLYDCRWSEVLGTPGSRVNRGGSGTMRLQQLYCVMTARGRSYVPGAGNRVWTDMAGGTYTVNRMALAHDSRGTFVTPPIIVQ